MSFKDLYKAGSQYLAEKRFVLAREAFLDALKLKKDDVYTLNKLAYVYSVLEETGKVSEVLDYVLKLQREDLYANYQMGTFLMEKEQFGDAEEFFKKALAIDSKDGYTKNALALLYRNRGETARAINLLEENIVEHPGDYFNHCSLILCQMDINNYDKARTLCGNLLASDPDNLQGMTLQGQIHEFYGEIEDAARCYKTVLEKDSSEQMAFYYLADLSLREAGHLDRFKLFVLLGENRSGQVKREIFADVVALRDEKKLDIAFQNFTALSEKYSDNESYLNSLGLILILMKKFSEAESTLKRSLALEGENSYAHYNLAYLSLLVGQVDLAIGHLEAAVEQDREDLYALNFLGFVQMYRGFYEKANRTFYAALKLSKITHGDSDGFSNYGLAMICKFGKDDEGAAEFFQSIVRDHPGSPVARRAEKKLSSGL